MTGTSDLSNWSRSDRTQSPGNEAEGKCLANQLGDVACLKASHQMVAVDFDRPDAELELAGDFAVRQSFHDQMKHAGLACGQRPRDPVPPLLGRRFGASGTLRRHGKDRRFT
jgi:hypothetical protein